MNVLVGGYIPSEALNTGWLDRRYKRRSYGCRKDVVFNAELSFFLSREIA